VRAEAASFRGPSNALERGIELVRAFLFGGNTVARVGILVLLVGVTLLLKYAAEHSLFPIELRMASAGVIGLALVIVGLRLRSVRAGFARTLQGGGIAAMYLVVFFSFRTYALLPPSLAFGLLVAIAASSAVLAVVQDAMALVVIGQIGGFLAPILASTGGGSHVALFSYYLVLNCAVFGIALYRAWRPLNLIGFVFTFAIGTTWGVTRYVPEHFASTEPFLIAFFLLYLAISVVFALRHEAHGFVDGTLVFGTPLAFLALQLALVREIPFAMAYTALGLAALYVALARILHRRAPEALRAMIEAFLALGVGFGTLAIPYGLDNAGLTSATWAIEGAGLYWIGVRQQRWLSRAAGVVLQGLAGIALAMHVADGAHSVGLPIVNTRMLAASFMCFGALFIAHQAHKHRARVFGWEASLLQALVGWGLLFFLTLALAEIDDHVATALRPGARIALLGGTGIALELAGAKLDTNSIRYPASATIALLAPFALYWEYDVHAHLLSHGGWFGWPIYFACMWLTLRRLVPSAPPPFAELHPLALVGCALFLALQLYRLTLDQAGLGRDWAHAAFGVGAIATLAFVTLAGPKRLWPFEQQRERYLGVGAFTLCAGIALWSLAFNLDARGSSAPLSYMPVVNPVDLTQLLGCAAIVAWRRAYVRAALRSLPGDLLAAVPVLLACLGFLWFNALLARSVHQLAQVSFSPYALWRSVALQVAFSISWTLIALGMTVLASRRKARAIWMAGAVLLGVVVIKLFAIDLARLSTLAKIGTFLVVGMLLLAIGYLAPVPPAIESATPPPQPEPEPPQPGPPAGVERTQEAEP
jgi:uncharacterized membrane protein